MKQEKTLFTLSTTIIVIMALFIAVLVGTFRYMTFQSAQSKANTAAEIVRESLTAHMITGSADYQNDLLKQIASVDGMNRAWVVRSDELSHQYGRGIHPQDPQDDIDRAVLRSGKKMDEIKGSVFSDTLYRFSIPYVATEKGKIDCLSCHDSKAGSVLGVVSIEMEINDLKVSGLIAVALTITTIIVLTYFLIRSIYRFIASYKETLHAVAQTMEHAEGGDYSHRIMPTETLDAYNAAMWTNSVMEKIDSALTISGKKMASLIRLDHQNSDPLNTLQMGIHQLYEVERFRTEIEKDQNLDEVYARIIALLRTRWNLSNFNILELNPLNKTTSVIHSEKTLLCDALSGCRADRTSGIVDSSQCEVACPKMIDPSAHYVCQSYPIVDDLDIVISLVTYEAHEVKNIRLALDQLGNYINASKLQIINKKLQQTVRIDPMTQLYNRAYLEEIAKLIVAQSTRTMIPYGILFVDMDQFDQINQSYGTVVADEVIKAMAHNIHENIRQGDILIRYSGDTFAVILYDYNRDEVDEVADTIRLSFKKKIRVNTYAILKTVSIGIAYFPDQTPDLMQGIEFAKRALLEAKHQGGNVALAYDVKSMPQ